MGRTAVTPPKPKERTQGLSHVESSHVFPFPFANRVLVGNLGEQPLYIIIKHILTLRVEHDKVFDRAHKLCATRPPILAHRQWM
jgi:hypothetical protein